MTYYHDFQGNLTDYQHESWGFINKNLFGKETSIYSAVTVIQLAGLKAVLVHEFAALGGRGFLTNFYKAKLL